MFVAWFERESVSAKIDRFIEINAGSIANTTGAAGEQSHEWWQLYQAYQQQFDILLQEFLDEASCTADEFLSAAEAAEGMK